MILYSVMSKVRFLTYPHDRTSFYFQELVRCYVVAMVITLMVSVSVIPDGREGNVA